MSHYCVIGGGPAGLTAALQLCRAGKSVTLVDENDALGGCHRVIRKPVPGHSPGLFSEHAPRVYSSAYLNTAALLASMAGAGSSFDDLFTPYNFSVSSIGAGGILHHLSVRECLWLAWAFLTMSADQAKGVSMADYMAQHNFSDPARDYVNRVCLLTDGAGAASYSLWQFLELANQQALYSLYQPRQPTDTGLFALWRQALLRAGCTIIQGRVTDVRLTWSHGFHITLQPEQGPGAKLQVPGQKIRVTHGVILAIPPASALPLFQKMNLPDLPALTSWVRATQYVTYIPVALHFDQPLPESVSRVHGFPDTEWGIAFVVLSDYFQHTDPESGVLRPRTGLISTVITLPDVPSSHTGLSANQTGVEEQVVAEVVRQLRHRLPGLPTPSHAFITPGVVYQGTRWHNPNTAYVAAAGTQPWGPKTAMPEIYSLGTHNGASAYSFTSMESAVTNALALTNVLEPASAVPLQSPWTLKLVLSLAAALLAALLVVAVIMKFS